MKAAVLMVGASLALTACGNMLASVTSHQLPALEKKTDTPIIVYMPQPGMFLDGSLVEGAICARGSGVGSCYLPVVEFHDGYRRTADCIIHSTPMETQLDLDFMATCLESARIGREQERYVGGDMKPPAPEPEPAAPSPSATSSDAGVASPDGPPQAGQCDPSDYDWPECEE